MKVHLITAFVLAATSAHGASLAFNSPSIQQASALSSRMTASSTVSLVQSIQTIQSVQTIRPIQTSQTLSPMMLSAPTLSIRTPLQAAPAFTIKKMQPAQVLQQPKLAPLTPGPAKLANELALDGAALATVTLQPTKLAPSALLDPSDAARLAVNNENLVPAARVVQNGHLVMLLDEREERRRAVQSEIAPAKETKPAPRITVTAASRRETLAASISRARRLATGSSSTRRLVGVSLPR